MEDFKCKRKIDYKECLDLYLTFFKIGAFTFGGGLAMLPALVKEFAEEKKWVTEDDILDFFAIGQSTPGIIIVNVATFMGYLRQRLLGAICATLGVITPSVIFVMIISGFLNNFMDNVLVAKMLKGINISVIALLLCIEYKFIKTNVKDKKSAILAASTAAVILAFDVPTFICLMAAGVYGLLLMQEVKKND